MTLCWHPLPNQSRGKLGNPRLKISREEKYKGRNVTDIANKPVAPGAGGGGGGWMGSLGGVGSGKLLIYLFFYPESITFNNLGHCFGIFFAKQALKKIFF